jgi:phospholipase/carboxylesterase
MHISLQKALSPSTALFRGFSRRAKIAAMNDAPNPFLEALAGAVLPLLYAMDALSFARQRVDPFTMPQLHEAVGHTAEPLEEALPAFRAAEWPEGEGLADFRERVETAAAGVAQAFAGLKAAAEIEGFDALRLARRGFKGLLEAERALYPMAALSPPISTYFLSEDVRANEALAAQLDAAADNPHPFGGIMEQPGPDGPKGGYARYIPEYLDASTPAPVIIALHGGRGNGPEFLWSWLQAARARRCILLAPTALGDTWAISSDDVDSPNIDRILAETETAQPLDRSRVLLTGMSDGGTFSYVSGLMDGSPATHLAPFAASFHPMLLEFVSPARVADLPIRLTHGGRDWMFAIDMARTAAAAFQSKSAQIDFHELPDRAHVFPVDQTASTLDWFLGKSIG